MTLELFWGIKNVIEIHLEDTYEDILDGKQYQEYYKSVVNTLIELLKYANENLDRVFDIKEVKDYYESRIKSLN